MGDLAAIERATAKQAAFREGWLEGVGLYFADPAADLAKAKTAFDAGDYVAARNNARSATDSWDGAHDKGILYLGVLAAVVIALGVVIFRFRPAQLGGRSKHPPVRFRSVAYEPPAPDDHRATSWRDWTNNPRRVVAR